MVELVRREQDDLGRPRANAEVGVNIYPPSDTLSIGR